MIANYLSNKLNKTYLYTKHKLIKFQKFNSTKVFKFLKYTLEMKENTTCVFPTE
jgi:hypothetical protein